LANLPLEDLSSLLGLFRKPKETAVDVAISLGSTPIELIPIYWGAQGLEVSDERIELAFLPRTSYLLQQSVYLLLLETEILKSTS
jgi:hypothetical protein